MNSPLLELPFSYETAKNSPKFAPLFESARLASLEQQKLWAQLYEIENLGHKSPSLIRTVNVTSHGNGRVVVWLRGQPIAAFNNLGSLALWMQLKVGMWNNKELVAKISRYFEEWKNEQNLRTS